MACSACTRRMLSSILEPSQSGAVTIDSSKAGKCALAPRIVKRPVVANERASVA